MQMSRVKSSALHFTPSSLNLLLPYARSRRGAPPAIFPGRSRGRQFQQGPPIGLASPSPRVSQQIRDLETGLRLRLFQRRGKRVLLSPAGLIFQEHARTVLRQLEKCFQELVSEPGQLRGILHLGVVPVLNVALIPSCSACSLLNIPRLAWW